MPRRNTKKSSVPITSHPTGAMQIGFPVDDPGPPKQRPPRSRRVTRKVLEDATADVSLISRLETPQNQENAQGSDPVVATTADLSDGHRVNDAVMPPSTTFWPNNEANLIVAVHNTPRPNPGGIPGSTPSTESRFWATSPSVPSQTPFTPRTPRGLQRGHRSVRFSVGRRCSHRLPNARQARNKNRHTAKDVWTFFDVDDDESQRGCLFCKKQVESGTRKNLSTFAWTTSSGILRRHLYENHIALWVAGCDDLKISITAKSALQPVADYRERQGFIGTTIPEADTRQPFSHEAFIDAIVRFIVADDQSINVVENPQLRALFLLLREDLKDEDIPHRTTIRSHIFQVWNRLLKQLADDMQNSVGKVSFTTDMWSDPNMTPYMAVTAHWLQSTVRATQHGPQHILKLRADLVGFLRVPGRHDGEHLAHAFIYVLDRISITSKIGWITLDNASNNDTFLYHLEELLSERNISFDAVHRRIRCFPHIVNLACKAVLSAMTNTDFTADPEETEEHENEETPSDPIATLRTLIRVIRASSIRRQRFSQVLKHLEQPDRQLLRDMVVRWSSTLLMVERALLLRTAIGKFLALRDMEELQKYELRATDWDSLEVCCKILSVPHAFQQRLSSDTTPTLCDALPAFEAMKSVWNKQKVEMPNVAYIIDAGLKKLDEYRARADLVPAYVGAMLVNPTIKLQWFQKHCPNKLPAIKDLFLQELQPYWDTYNSTDHHDDASASSESAWANDILGLNICSSHANERPLATEVDAYLLDSQFSTTTLNFWQENQLRFPTIFAYAMDILPIQASAVPSERVFSSAKETTTARRNKLSPELMEALQILKFSITKGNCLDFTAGTSRGAEIELLEAMATEEGVVPEDIMAFIDTLELYARSE